MAIPSTPFSGCDCCGYGFEMFEATGQQLLWYLSQGNTTSTTGRLESLFQSNGTSTGVSSFDDASRIHAMATVSGTPYFYTYRGPQQVRKYDFDGNLSWTYAAGAGIVNSQPSGFSNNTHRLGADENGNVYLVASAGSAGSRKMFASKIDSSGSEVWAKQVTHHGGSGDYWGLFITSDASGNVAAVGSGGITYWDSAGNQQWGVNQPGHKLCFDDAGNIYIVANTSPQSVSSYDSAGAFRFSLTLTGATQGFFSDIEIFGSKLYTCWYNSTSAKVFLSCRSDSTFSTVDWAVEIPYTNNMLISPNFAAPRITVDSSGNLYVAYSTIDGSSNIIGYFHRLAAADGSEDYSDTRSIECLSPMIAPGRPPIFF